MRVELTEPIKLRPGLFKDILDEEEDGIEMSITRAAPGGLFLSGWLHIFVLDTECLFLVPPARIVSIQI